MRNIGELVLIHYEDQPTVYARVEKVELDVKKDWYHLTLLLLTIPAQVVTWILRETYIDGTPFTMGGKAMRIDTVDVAGENRSEGTGTQRDRKRSEKSGTVIPFRPPR